MIYPIVSYFVLWLSYMLEILAYLIVVWIFARILAFPIGRFTNGIKRLIDF